MVAAFPLLMTLGKTGEAYNAGRGETYRIQELLDRLVAFSRVKLDVRQTQEPGRKADTTVTRADPGKLFRTTGWSPRITLDQTLSDILDDWRRTTSAS
jgi:GDP-4-dehydro-6-deoxy-D-mannose reductase